MDRDTPHLVPLELHFTRLDLGASGDANHAFTIITKLHVSDRSEAILRARDAGLGGAGSG
jgi:hypothetical protein